MRAYTYWFDSRWNFDEFVNAYKEIVPKGTTFVEAEDDNEECITESYFGGIHVCHKMTMAEPCPSQDVISDVAHRHGYNIEMSAEKNNA